MKKLKVLELFAGIGACSKALENLKIPHEIVDAVEIDKFAIQSFNAIHNTNFEPQDICEWDKDIEVDLIMHGSPCQDFSLAGKQAGGDKDSGTRSSLMYETLRIVEKLKPKYVIWENVKNILSQRHVHNWDAYANFMEELGYTNYCQLLNAKDYGVPQNRERVFTISIKDYYDKEYNCYLARNFRFPNPQPLNKTLKDILEPNVDEKYYLTQQKIDMISKWKGFEKPLNKIMSKNTICSTLTTRSGADCNSMKLIYDGYNSRIRKDQNTIGTLTTNCGVGNIRTGWKIITANKKGYDIAKDGDGIDLSYPNSKTRRGRVGHGVAKTIPTSNSQGVVDGIRIRKLTPKECWRLMGFDDVSFKKAEKINSNSQLYKQAGNSIVVDVLEAIIKNLTLS